MNKYGPTRGELWFRVAFSLVGLSLMIFALLYRGVAGLAWMEIVIFAGAFFGGSLVHSLWKLTRTTE